MNKTKHEKIDTMRMKDIVCQLTDVIYLLCDAKGADIITILNQFTNLSNEELESLNISFPNENKRH